MGLDKSLEISTFVATIVSFFNEYFSFVAHVNHTPELYDDRPDPGSISRIMRMVIDVVAIVSCAFLAILHSDKPSSSPNPTTNALNRRVNNAATPIILAFFVPTLIMSSVIRIVSRMPKALQYIVGFLIIQGLAATESQLVNLSRNQPPYITSVLLCFIIALCFMINFREHALQVEDKAGNKAGKEDVKKNGSVLFGFGMVLIMLAASTGVYITTHDNPIYKNRPKDAMKIVEQVLAILTFVFIFCILLRSLTLVRKATRLFWYPDKGWVSMYWAGSKKGWVE